MLRRILKPCLASAGEMLCSVRDFAKGEEGLTALLDTGFSCCRRMFNDKRNCSDYVNNNSKNYI